MEGVGLRMNHDVVLDTILLKWDDVMVIHFYRGTHSTWGGGSTILHPPEGIGLVSGIMFL